MKSWIQILICINIAAQVNLRAVEAHRRLTMEPWRPPWSFGGSK
jgi:hypothetical protein